MEGAEGEIAAGTQKLHALETAREVFFHSDQRGYDEPRLPHYIKMLNDAGIGLC